MNLYWFGCIVVGLSLVLWFLAFCYRCYLVSQDKTVVERNLEMKGLENVATWALVVGIGLMMLTYFFMTKEEKAKLKTLSNDGYKPSPPLAVSWRGSKIGASKVLQIRNDSKAQLQKIVVRVRNPKKFSQDEHLIESLNPGEVYELGWTKWNWNLQLGDEVKIQVHGFSEDSFTFD